MLRKNGKNDCVIMTDDELLVKMKFAPYDEFEMYDMTERFLYTRHLHKLQR